ncbi:NlpC/P60 family protein [uncultured Desulfovibrio sp.]|uniref:C40 family peptidase n=1 Tax=uncultured Desulfovibrio sp. TaxID=167968 RepID=UPI002602DAD5|nr:NlpC/P60 family protein [uncultured Desulfovibrio sp.]
MRQALNLLTLFLISAVLLGCTARKQQDKDLLIRYRANVEDVLNRQEDARDRASGQSVVKTARSAIGTPYVPGGRNPGGFDCSGLVQWAYQSVGVKLPRTAREQSTIGQRIMRVEDMRAGDIVAFRHPRRGYHTGIYVGDGKFVHSPRRRSSVKISSLDDPYFNNTFLGARRVSMSAADGQDLVAQAESRMAQYTEERAVRDMERSRKARQEAAVESRKKGKQSSKVTSQRKKKDQVRKPSEQRRKSRDKASASRKSGKSKSKAAALRQSGKSKSKAAASRQSGKSKTKARASSQQQKKKDKGASRSSRKSSSKKK